MARGGTGVVYVDVISQMRDLHDSLLEIKLSF